MTDLAPVSMNKSHLFRDDATQFGEPVGWLRTEIDRLFDDFGKPARNIFNFRSRGPAPVSALELANHQAYYRLIVELSGLAEDDFEISVADGMAKDKMAPAWTRKITIEKA
jgi:HSP20 family protein